MTCPQCAFENPPAMTFCGRCGARLASLCPSCGFANPEGFAFCGKCGASVAEVRVVSPRSYTPKHLAEKILTSKAALEGGGTGSHPSERKQVTVLFADLKGSMELLADRDPEEARKILDPVLTLMMDAVHHYEGTVNPVDNASWQNLDPPQRRQQTLDAVKRLLLRESEASVIALSR